MLEMDEDYSYDESLRRLIVKRLKLFPLQELKPGSLKSAAVAITLIEEADSTAFILTRRAANLRNHSGQMALPGGRLEKGEGAEEAALRELSEEVGLRLDRCSILGRLDDYRTRSGYLISPVVVWAGGPATLIAQETEVSEIYRIQLSELNRQGSPEFVQITESEQPVIRLLLGNDKLHAPSAALVYQFREVCLFGRHTRVSHLEQPVWAWQ